MSFLNPALLFFASAVAVPILIHLLNRRRFQRVTWAAMRFVQASLEKNRRRMQLEDLLLLLLRCLVVALLAFALARPAVRSASARFGGARVDAVVILDRSASLRATDGARARFDLARQAAEAAVDAFPSGSSVAVLFAGDRVSAPLPEPSPDLNLARKVLREAVPSELATDHGAALTAALDILKGRTALRKEIVLVTDRQATGWRRLPEIEGLLEQAGRDTRLRVVFVGEPLEDNLAVSSVTRSAGFASVRDPMRFLVEVTNHGALPVRQVRVTLHLDGGPAVDESVLDVLAAGESRRVTFFARFSDEGFHSVTARLPGDRMPADDERTVVVPVVGEVRVLVVDGDPESNSAFFLKHALQPVPADVAPQYFLQPRVVTAAQLAVTRFSDFGAVVLADPPALAAPVIDQLVRYVADGGALLVFPGPKANPDFYRRELVERAGLLPATLGKVRGQADSEESLMRLQSSGYRHPVFSLWNDTGAGSLGTPRFRAAWELLPAAARTNASGGVETSEPMVLFSDGTPAAFERVVGRGRVMIFSSTAGTAWNDLAVRPVFVPLLHRSIAALTDARERRYNLRVGGLAQLTFPGELTGREVAVAGPGRPERRVTTTLRASGGGAGFEFEGTERAGLYRIAPAGGGADLAVIATQPDPMESVLIDVTAERLAEIARWSQVVDWSADLDLRTAFDRERMGLEFWLPLALAVLLLGGVETWLAQRFSRPK
jgi:hypothetical protein